MQTLKRVEVNASDKYSSLLRYGNNYACKNFYSTGQILSLCNHYFETKIRQFSTIKNTLAYYIKLKEALEQERLWQGTLAEVEGSVLLTSP